MSLLPRILRTAPASTYSALSFGQDEESSGSDIRPERSQSIVNGSEHTLPERPQREGPGNELVSWSQSDHGALKAKNAVLDDLANKSMPPEESEYIIRRLEKRADERLQRTYVEGMPVAGLDDSAIVLHVGLTFLPGADKPQVNRIEQTNMTLDRPPDQKDADWRVNTAGALLMQFDVSADLSIVRTDQTSIVVAQAKSRLASRRDTFFPEQRRALTATIDSDEVKIVNDLRAGTWDIQATLIEVDAPSLSSLMVNYRTLIRKGGPDMTFEETRVLLETMIEDARRLCVRSPILFRMSTRTRIMNSQNTRYGIDHGPMFRTLTTSKGIKEIISLSASYYNSLDPTAHSDTAQKFIRPRFLQMIVLLLSLLNNDDLADIQDFLESTYKLKADRRNIELLFLKVIPLLSINPKVFLKALVPAIEGFPLGRGGLDMSSDTDAGQSHIWNVFVKRILADGYLLPGTVAMLGRDCLSWIVNWPKDGFKSTSVFNDLQYGGQLKTMNDIPPIELNPGASMKELTVVMTDGSQYTISPTDLEKITCLTRGIYPVQEIGPSKKSYDLEVRESQINTDLVEAVKMTNAIIHEVNNWLAGSRRNGTVKGRLRRKPAEPVFLHEAKSSGRLTKNVAVLNGVVLAVAYKVEGRKISRTDSVRNMARDLSELTVLICMIESRCSAVDHRVYSNEKRDLRQSLDNVKGQIALADQSRTKIGSFDEISDEPIAKCLYPEGTDGREPSIWNDYKAYCQEKSGLLHVEGKASSVTHVKWLSDNVIELSLSNQTAKIYATPLQPTDEGCRDDEVRVDDVVMLLGQYVIIAEADEYSSDPNAGYIMTNYLRVTSIEEQTKSRRGMNRNRQSETVSCCTFR